MKSNYSSKLTKAFLLLLLLLSISTVQAKYTKTVIMLSGQDAPGVPGAKFSSIIPPTGIGLSDNGKALFRATLEIGVGGITRLDDEGIWLYEAGAIRLIAQKGGFVPRFTGVRFFNDRMPVGFIDPSGQVGLDAWYSLDGTTSTNSVHAFFIEESGVLFQKVVPPIALPTGDTVVPINFLAFNNGRVLFDGIMMGATVIGRNDVIIGHYKDGAVDILIQSEKPTPVVPGDWRVHRMTSQALLTAAGKTVFSVQALIPGGGPGIGVVYSWDPIAKHTALRVSGIDSTFVVFGNYQLNTQGNNINRSWVVFGTTYGILDVNGNVIVAEGDVADGAGGAFISSSISYGLFDNDTAIIHARTSDGQKGIWGGDASGLKKIVRVGDPAPGIPFDLKFFRVNAMELNRNGQFAIADLAVNTITGVELSGVWIGTVDRSLRLVIVRDERIEIAPTVFKTVKEASFSARATPRTGADGLPTILNDNGSIILGVNFTDGSNGLVLAVPGGMIVNTNGDAPDDDVSDGICDTGNDLPNGEPECTLRAAIMETNAHGGFNGIDFDIEGSTIITPQTALPVIRRGVTINGKTQPDGRPIVLDGTNVLGASGLEIAASGVTIAGLEIGRFIDGIKIVGTAAEAAKNNDIIDCYIGIRSDSPAEFGNFGDGIRLVHAKDNQIGSSDFIIRGGDGTVRNFSGWNYITGNFGHGIRIDSSSTDNKIQHNVIGLRKDGTKKGNLEGGVVISFSSDKNQIGGVDSQERNIIADNIGDGVTISGGSFNKVVNNFIGLKEDGSAAGNIGFGVLALSDSNLVGGEADSGNVISNNGQGGVEVRTATGNLISGNYIGVDTTGLLAMGNRGAGVSLIGSDETIIGVFLDDMGDERGKGNIISGNDSAGVLITDDPPFESRKNLVASNLIGVGADNATALPNMWGVIVHESQLTEIGPLNHIRENKRSGVLLLTDDAEVFGNRIERNGFVVVPGRGPARGDGIVIDGRANSILVRDFPQLIAHNNGVGVRVLSNEFFNTSFNQIVFNSIWDNVRGGIDLDPVGPNPIDPLDADDGPNDGQNAPELHAPFFVETNVVSISGILRSKPNASYTIDAYSNAVCDTSGLGQGQFWIGSASVTTNSMGLAQIDFEALAFGPTFLTLTATDILSNTSEFSNCEPVLSGSVDLVVTKSDGIDSSLVGDTIHYEITVANHGAEVATGVTLIDSLTAQVSYVSDTSAHGSCVFIDGHLNCNLGAMPPGDSATVILIVNVNAVGLIENRASAFASEGDTNPLDNLAIDSTFVTDTQTDVGDDDSPALPREFLLSQNHPNPFNPSTVISYTLPKKAHVTLAIYNILGQNVRTIEQGTQSAGRYEVSWNAVDDHGEAVSSGMYFYKLVAGDFTASRKMVLLK